MIAGTYFDGDDDSALAWIQHDCYHEALFQIVNGSRNILRDQGEDATGLRAVPTSFDHRCLQMAHDILGASWRFDPSRWSLHRAPPGDPQIATVLWLSWLAREVGSWAKAPHLAGLVCQAVRLENRPGGYRAETQLCLALLLRFPKIPWATLAERGLGS